MTFRKLILSPKGIQTHPFWPRSQKSLSFCAGYPGAMEVSLDFSGSDPAVQQGPKLRHSGLFSGPGPWARLTLLYVTGQNLAEALPPGISNEWWWMNQSSRLSALQGLWLCSPCALCLRCPSSGSSLADLSVIPREVIVDHPLQIGLLHCSLLHTLFIPLKKLAPYRSYLTASSPACGLSLSWVSKLLNVSAFCMLCSLPYN